MPLKAHSGLTHLIRKSSRTSGCIIQITDHTSLSCARKSSNYRAPTVVMQLEQRILPQDSSGIDPIISPLYYHKGWLRKMGGKFKSWKKRYFILEGYQLSYFTNPEELRLLGKLSLKETQVEVPQLQDNDFGLDHKGYLFVIKSALFGTSLNDVFPFTRPEHGYQPRVVHETIAFIRAHGMETEGIFRKCGSQQTIHELSEAYDVSAPGPVLQLQHHNVHIAAGLLKLYLRELPEPIIPFQLYDRLKTAGCKIADDQDLNDILDVVEELPSPNYHLLQFLCGFLYEVSQHEKTNLMTIQNLASVFAPNVLRPVDCDLDVEMAASPIISLTVAELIRCHAQLFRLHLAPCRFAAANGSVVSTQRRQKLVRRRRSHHTADTILLPPPPYHTPPQPILGHREPESNGDIEDNCRSWIQRPAQQKFRAIPRDWPPGVDPNIPPELCRQMDVWNEKTGYSDNTGKLHFIGTYDNIMPENLSVQTPYPAVSTFYERDSRLPYGPREIFENLRPTNHDNLTFSLDKSHSDSLPHPRMNRSVTAHSHLNGIQRSTQHQDRRPCNAPAGCGVVTQADDSALSSSYSSDFESLRLWHDKTRLSNRTVNSPIRTFTLNTHTAPHNFVEYPAYSKTSTVPFLTQKPYSDSDASVDRCVKPDHTASTLMPGCTAVNPISAEDQTQYWQTLAIRARAEAAGQRARAHSLSRELKKVQCDLNMARLEIRLLRQGLANSGDYTAVDSYQNPGNLRHRANNGIWPS